MQSTSLKPVRGWGVPRSGSYSSRLPIRARAASLPLGLRSTFCSRDSKPRLRRSLILTNKYWRAAVLRGIDGQTKSDLIDDSSPEPEHLRRLSALPGHSPCVVKTAILQSLDRCDPTRIAYLRARWRGQYERLKRDHTAVPICRRPQNLARGPTKTSAARIRDFARDTKAAR
jgi:hypothetical protein